MKRIVSSKALERITVAFILLLASATRLIGLGYPPKLVFDETYYVKDALTLAIEGHEMKWPENANSLFESGEVYGYLNESAFVVHPPLGKWLIAAGMWLVGPEQSFGWRLSSAILGIATVALLMMVAYKLFGSKIMALASGFLLAIDGLAITLSRTALLDSSLTFFLLLGFYFLLLDQDLSRTKIASGFANQRSQVVVLRPWLIAAGLALGLAAAIKWSGFYLIAAVGLYVVISETLMRQRGGEKNWLTTGLFRQGLLSFLNLVPIALLSYLSSWIGWILGSGGYGRNWSSENSLPGIFAYLPNWLQSLWHYHEVIYRFHVNLRTDHSYEAHPLTWLIGFRPTAFFYESYDFGENDCLSPVGCSSAITALGNPLIWWGGTLALLFILYRYLRNRERLFGLILFGVAGLYLPWLVFSERTVFQFYSISFLPWMILALVLAVRIAHGSIAIRNPRLANTVLLGFFLLTFALAIFFIPINTGLILPFDWWQLRMWLPSWI